MSKTFITGTVKSLMMTHFTCEPINSYILTIEENDDFFITADSSDFPCAQNELQIGAKYRFQGELNLPESLFTVNRIVESSSDMEPESDALLIQGYISEVKFVQSIRGSDVAIVKFNGMPDLKVIFLPEICSEFQKIYSEGKEIAVTGYLNTKETPQFYVEKAMPRLLENDSCERLHIVSIMNDFITEQYTEWFEMANVTELREKLNESITEKFSIPDADEEIDKIIKELIKHKGGNAQNISLEFYADSEDNLKYYKRIITTEELTGEDFQWLTKKIDYETRVVIY